MLLLTELKALVPGEGRVTDDPEALERHGHGWGHHLPRPPDAVVYPRGREEVAEVLRFADAQRVPVVPFGLGSSIEGQVVPVRGGISLDLSEMNRVLEARPEDFVARVQPGVTRNQLNESLRPHGVFFPVDPGWDASIGGMAATNASGTNAVRYGAMRDQVLGLEVVLADGRVLRTGGMSVKSSAGYNLTGLFVGSEGTLGVFTEVIVKLYPIPEHAVAGRAVFPDAESAGRAAVRMIGSGMNVGRVELVDGKTVAAVNAYKGTGYAEAPTLFLEFSGSRVGAERDAVLARRMAEAEGCTSFDADGDEEARKELWEARHEVGLALEASAPGKRVTTTDVCVPISCLSGALRHARRTVEAHGLDGVILGHVGDGNYHAAFMVDPSDPSDVARTNGVNAEIVEYALRRGGTCTGEHGIGLGKMEHLRTEHGSAMPFMRALKRTADPNNVMNPGKIFEDPPRRSFLEGGE